MGLVAGCSPAELLTCMRCLPPGGLASWCKAVASRRQALRKGYITQRPLPWAPPLPTLTSSSSPGLP